MLLRSDSFSEGAAIPGEFAFAVPDPKTHVSLSRNRNPHLVWSDAPRDDEVIRFDLPRLRRAESWR